MTLRAARIFSAMAALWLALAAPALAQQSPRTIITTPDGDYFGFDLRSEQNVTLDQCKTNCLGDSACRAFTYNTKAKWCFLKSDWAKLNPFKGAVAGKVVNVAGAPDIGAAPQQAFFPTYMVDEARRYRTELLAEEQEQDAMGFGFLTIAAQNAMAGGDAASAIEPLRSALKLTPDDPALWIKLARALVAAKPTDSLPVATLQRDGTAAIWNGYALTRGTALRAEALAVMAQALDRRDMSRPALAAYQASLALVNDRAIRDAYLDLKARKGFRVVDHTIDAENTAPRVCLQLSEELVKAGVDYAPFVTVDDRAPQAVDAKDKQICVEGLEHGKRYRIALRQGLPAAIGEVIELPVVINVYVPDRSPSLRFTGESFVLPATARHGIPVVSVNTGTANVRLFRVGDRGLTQLLSGYKFLRQLDTYDAESIADELGQAIWEGKLAIDNQLNKEVTTSFPVDEALPERKPGVYVLVATPDNDKSDSWDSKATQWFVVSDIGLATYTGDDGLHAFARSLSSAKPLAGVELTLLAKNNEVLGKATSDADGKVVFNPGLTRGEGGMVPAVLMAQQPSKDFVFLDMARAGFDLSDRGVTGRATPGALDVFTWTERGIYRAGETVHVGALARNDSADAIRGLPLTFIFARPDGVADRRVVADGAALGGYGVELPLQTNAMRGTWSVAVHTDPKQPAIASQNFLVEDFVPDRTEFDMTSDKPEIAIGEKARITVDGRYLYGAPAAGLMLEGEVNLSTTRQWNTFPGYSFGLADEEQGEEGANRIALEELPAVGEDGKASFEVGIDNPPSTTRLLKAEVVVRMREGGGRAVERKLDLAVRPQGPVIGVRAGFDGDVPEGTAAKFTIIAADPSGKRQAMPGLIWSIVKVERQYQWYRANNSWNYEPVTYTTKVANGRLDVAADGNAEISAPVTWGRYRLEVETPDPQGPVTSYEFDAGWYVSQTSTETPDGLEVALDKESYAAGEVAKLQVSPRFAGELLVTVGADRLLATYTATVPEGGAAVDIPVSADWGAGAYVTATLYRPGEARESRMPMRAIGLKWLKVDPGSRKLAIAIDTVAKTEPRKTLDIPVSVTGARPGEDAYVIVAAVDVGILNLTKYKAPDPEGWYFGQRKLGLEIRDLYGRLIDGSLGTMGRIRTGGDGGGMASEGNPPTEKLVAFFSGPVKLDAAGKATISFDIPQFNGTARVMAVAWTAKGVGHAQKDVIIRDPIVVIASQPRFLSPGDQSQLRLDIANTDGPAGDYTVAVETNGKVKVDVKGLDKGLKLAVGGKATLTVPLAGGETGDGIIDVRLANATGLTIEQQLIVPVRPAAMPMTTRRVVSLAANGGSLKVDRELLASSLLDGATVTLGVSPVSAFDIPSLLMTLDRYPYGCAEQTTSRALPLLYVSELAKEAGLEDDPALRERIQGAIERVLSYQSSSGSFGLWGPGSGDLWLDAYVTDFLTRAREKDYAVPAFAMQQAVENLQNSLSYDVNVKDNGGEVAYALYVLARNRQASVGDLRYYSDTQLDDFSSPMARAQLAASLALYGDSERAQRVFASALSLAKAQTGANYDRSDYGSSLRDGAAMLALAAETRPAPAQIEDMVKFVAATRKAATYTSTQEEAWMLLAARAIRAGSAAIRLDVDGMPHSGGFSRRVSGLDLQAAPITVANRGPNPVEAVVTTVAAPAQPLPAGGNGFAIERKYYTLDGEEANVTEAKQNERFVVVLTVTEQNSWPSRVLITDLLPAGFEIDNPRIVGSADLQNFDWLEAPEVAHTEFRSDRFVAAFDRMDGDAGEFSMAYVVRAVTPGDYAHPAAQVEDMYRPQFSARTAAGMMRVVAN